MTDWDVDYARSEQAGTPVLAITGEIDLSSATRFAQELASLLADEDDAVRVDLSAVTFLDSSGVRELLAANRQAVAAGTQLQLANPSAPCRRVLEISGVWGEFVVEGTEQS
ncbi:MAG: anti-sigma factor antagonist [Actinomycetota bacterium]|nr:anti-sigma factor antagonist [Actinomycetota bacterium]